MQLFLGLLLQFTVFFCHVQFGLASTRSSHRIEDVRGRAIEFVPLSSYDPISKEGEAIAYLGLRIASCIGKLTPSTCLSDVVWRAHYHADSILLNLLDRPAYLETPFDEHNSSCLGTKCRSRIHTNTIFSWMLRYAAKTKKSFYGLFDIDKSKFSFEMLAILDIIGLTARLNPHLAKYLGIARAISRFVVKCQEENKPQNGGHKRKRSTVMIQEKHQVDSIVAYLGGDFNSKDIFELNNLNLITLTEWESLILHLLRDNNRLGDLDTNEDDKNFRVLIPKHVPIQTILKGIIDSYDWKSSFEENWNYERCLVIPGLADVIKSQIFYVNSSGGDGAQDEINGEKWLPMRYVARLLYGWSSSIQDFIEFFKLLRRPLPRFKLQGEEMCKVLIYSSFFYAMPNQAKQMWLWGLVKDGLLSEEEKENESNGEKDISNKRITSTSKNSPLITRVELYQQGVKACGQQKPDQNILSLLKMIDENRVEVISNKACSRVPLLGMHWSLDNDDNLSVQFKPSSKADLSRDDDKTKTDFINNNGIDGENETESFQGSNSDVFNEANRENMSKKSKKIKTGYCSKPTIDPSYGVYVLNRELIHVISLNGTIYRQDPLILMSGDLLIISSDINNQYLDEMARIWFSSLESGNGGGGGGYLSYMLLTTLSVAIRVL